MASIFERKRIHGAPVYRVQLVKKGIPKLSVTFYDYDEAVDWILEHEMEYYKNPDRYANWKEEMYIQNMKNRYSSEKPSIVVRKRY